jgi:hypothetical protein
VLPGAIESVVALARAPGGGWLVASRVGADGRTTGMSTQGFSVVSRLDDSLQPIWTRFGGGRFAAGSDGSVAWFVVPERAESPGHLTLTTGTTLRAWRIPFPDVADPIGVGAAHAVVYNLATARGDPRGTWRTTLHGHPQRLPLYLGDAAAGTLVAGRLSDGCLVVLDGTTRLWRRCDGLRAAEFSPGGRYLAAWHTATGGEFESAYVLDARTGHTVTTTTDTAPRAFHGMPSGSVAWEDDQHLLLAFDDALSDDWEVLRLGLAGRLTRATGAVHERDTESAFVLGH